MARSSSDSGPGGNDRLAPAPPVRPCEGSSAWRAAFSRRSDAHPAHPPQPAPHRRRRAAVRTGPLSTAIRRALWPLPLRRATGRAPPTPQGRRRSRKLIDARNQCCAQLRLFTPHNASSAERGSRGRSRPSTRPIISRRAPERSRWSALPGPHTAKTAGRRPPGGNTGAPDAGRTSSDGGVISLLCTMVNCRRRCAFCAPLCRLYRGGQPRAMRCFICAPAALVKVTIRICELPARRPARARRGPPSRPFCRCPPRPRR